MKRILATLTLGLAALAPAEESPTLIPFQGRLTDQAGNAYTNGQYTLTFNVYDTAVGGVSRWAERHEKVGVVNGMVNVFLGSIQPITTNVNFANTMYLGITIDADGLSATADPEMVPRQMIIPAFYARNAAKMAGYDWSAILEGGANNPTTAYIRGDKIQSNSINSDKIANGAVSSEKLADGAVNGAALASNSVGAASIVPGSITVDRLASRTVSTNGIAGLGEVGFSLPTVTSIRNLSNVEQWLYITNSSLTITTSGRPVLITTDGEYSASLDVKSGQNYGAAIRIRRRQISPPQAMTNDVRIFTLYQNNSSVLMEMTASLTGIDTPPAGTHEYWMEHILSASDSPGGNPTSTFYGTRLVVLEF